MVRVVAGVAARLAQKGGRGEAKRGRWRTGGGRLGAPPSPAGTSAFQEDTQARGEFSALAFLSWSGLVWQRSAQNGKNDRGRWRARMGGGRLGAPSPSPFPPRTKLRSWFLSSWSALAFLVVVVAGVRQRARHKKAGEANRGRWRTVGGRLGAPPSSPAGTSAFGFFRKHEPAASSPRSWSWYAARPAMDQHGEAGGNGRGRWRTGGGRLGAPSSPGTSAFGFQEAQAHNNSRGVLWGGTAVACTGQRAMPRLSAEFYNWSSTRSGCRCRRQGCRSRRCTRAPRPPCPGSRRPTGRRSRGPSAAPPRGL